MLTFPVNFLTVILVSNGIGFLITQLVQRLNLINQPGNTQNNRHRLIALGITGHQAVELLLLVSLIIGCLALVPLALPQVYGMAIFFGTLVAGFGLIF